MPYKAKELEKIIKKEGKVTIPFHSKDIAKATEISILKQAGLK